MKQNSMDELLETLRVRFGKHMQRHDGVAWEDVRAKLMAADEAIRVLAEMEKSGGEPDVIGLEAESGKHVFCDCSAESPAGRRSLCYDRRALDARKATKPSGCATELASAIGACILTEPQYHELQRLGEFDTRTSSWVLTPHDVRGLGGALFCDRRFGRVFTYHNGADSYYAARGFRTRLVV